ncbi:isopentenyl-diphosphate Delta-isomerase 1-like [Pollicipes pollicipes]|uniref:isopentenyl-diphosphate Delta-isomerase 1-like n=1 Tax=Pollicipes pollicipes TaxID=41117 RepID=UPI001884F1EB|nr:isopentenyl-diphosphate Delta-isomerase 1-like [Pollicipes pollicipes]XP_037093430.1 isopentenyl-diphosphate Delta-isomerase 1-like [Pollicipes pollicipes]
MACLTRLLRSACGGLAPPWGPLATFAKQGGPASRQVRRASLVGATVDRQQELLLDEMCLLVDERDRQVGAATKRQCHEWRQGGCPLHRAFSVFLFDSRDRLLLQRRSDVKITFPGSLTNTCCSHPLAVPGETEGADGVIRAAQRRLAVELGIQPEQVPESAFQYLTRIHYKAASDGGVWGEHEIDYILVVRGDVRLEPNPNEVKDVHYVARPEMAGFLAGMERAGVELTPWFKLITDTWLMRWWEHLDDLKQFEDHDTIHRL